MHETLPLSQIHAAVLEFLQGRDDVVLFCAQAVNAYVDQPRMTQDVDLLSNRALQFSEELRLHSGEKFHIVVRTREIKAGLGFRIYQVRGEGNRHLVDVRSVERLPKADLIENILVLSPIELIISKVNSLYSRQGKPKAGTDWRDLAVLLLRFPELKEKVEPALRESGVEQGVLTSWAEIASRPLQDDDDDGDLSF
ncbi:MAG: hypothetical protein ABIP75_00210 [Pyrinomonadaceae bacterium]